jgi:glycosyltransferase involved in cell wall biosynthesis
MNSISIIIPVINEEKNIAALLDYLLKIQNTNIILEIIVVDGKSIDTTKTIIQSYKEIVYLESEKGRAVQMNAGAKKANGNILYFLHCDSFPPTNFEQQIINEIKNKNFAGCFKMKFDSNHLVLKVSQWFTQFNFKVCRGGDQSLFITKDLFLDLKGSVLIPSKLALVRNAISLERTIIPGYSLEIFSAHSIIFLSFNIFISVLVIVFS